MRVLQAQLVGIVAGWITIGAAVPATRPDPQVVSQGRSGGVGAPSARVQVLKSVAAVPPDIVGELREPAAYVQAGSGQYFILDRRGHGVYALDRERTGAWRLVQIGAERGRVIEPVGFGFDPILGTFVVVDMPDNRPRIQRFASAGTLLGGFYLPAPATAPLIVNGVAVVGLGAFAYTGHAVLVSTPGTGPLVSEFGMAGEPLRSFGTFRVTGQEADPEVHQALNLGIPVPAAGGETYYVFQSGVPAFRKYDATGRLLYERHIEGPELDPLVQAMPTTWPRKKTGGGRVLPLVAPMVRAAAVDGAGNLWISLAVPFTYVYNPQGERIRVVQFRGAGIVAPTSLFFTSDGRLLVTPGCYEFCP